MVEEFPLKYAVREQPDDGFKCADVRGILIKIFSQVTDEVLFGRENKITVQGMTIPEATDKLFHLIFHDTALNPLNALLGGYLAQFKLLKSSRSAVELNREIERVIEKEYNLRMGRPLDQLGMNILDLMVKHNRSCAPGEILSVHDIASNCMLF